MFPVLLSSLLATTSVSKPEPVEDDVKISLTSEIGFVGVLDHTIQLSNNGTAFDYVDEGGQDVLSFFARTSAELRLFKNHVLTLLYQPLEFNNDVVFRRNHVFDGIQFPGGTPVRAQYSFPFWRLSYMYDFLDSPIHEAAFGFSMQIRNASIVFSTADGAERVARRNVGPVPLLRFRGRWTPHKIFWAEFEIDGMYAPISVLNGSDNEVTGALVDTSLRAGYAFSPAVSMYLNVRYIGGGAVGTSEGDPPPSDGYNKNWIHLMTTSLGFQVMLTELW